MLKNGGIAGYSKSDLCAIHISKPYASYGKSMSSVFLQIFFPNPKYLISSARIFFGRGAVMAKALGTTVEEEHRLGLSKIATVRSHPRTLHSQI
jgi:hypothetical protein